MRRSVRTAPVPEVWTQPGGRASPPDRRRLWEDLRWPTDWLKDVENVVSLVAGCIALSQFSLIEEGCDRVLKAELPGVIAEV